jgi:hypothetical protein
MLEKRNTNQSAKEQIILGGDLTSLTAVERVHYYLELCSYLGLDAIAHPFDYIKSKGRLSLYINAAGTAQLRKLHNVSLRIIKREVIEDVYIVTVLALCTNDRSEESSGMISIAELKGEDKCNAMLKAETKAKRRATLSVCGLGWVADTDSPVKAEFYDPLMDVVNTGMPPNVEAWRNWDCENNAIEWALGVCDLDRNAIEKILREVKSDKGKKAVVFYNHILSIQNR